MVQEDKAKQKLARRLLSHSPERSRGGEGGPAHRSFSGGGDEFEKKVLQVDRVARTVRGGKRIRFRALVIVGNRAGKVGMGVGKAVEVAGAVEKASRNARKHLIEVPTTGGTIPHQIEIRLGSAHIFLKPGRSGIVAGGTIRAICELAGIKNIVAKILGTANKINNSKAAFEVFERLLKEKNASSIKIDKKY